MRITLAALLLLAATPALAQNTSPLPPYVYPATVTSTPSQVLPQNNARRSVEFCNPNAAITIAVCPVRSRLDSSAITCAVNGAGSITLPPSTCWGKSVSSPAALSTAWNGVAGSSAKITVFETE